MIEKITIIGVMIFLTVLWTLMWKVATADGMLLEKIGQWGEKKVKEGHKIYDGLLVCPWCLPNIHGILFVWPLAFLSGILPSWDLSYLYIYPFCLGGSCFASGMLWQMYLISNRKKDYYEHVGHFYYQQIEPEKEEEK